MPNLSASSYGNFGKATKAALLWFCKMHCPGAAIGNQVNEVNKDAFIAASKPIYQEFGKEVPGADALIDKAIALGK